MLLTFKTSSYANITMLGEVGRKMLDMMAYGSSVPGAIVASDVPTALDNLRKALDNLPSQEESAGEVDEDQPAVSMHTRAIPLVELLQAAAADETHIRWE